MFNWKIVAVGGAMLTAVAAGAVGGHLLLPRDVAAAAPIPGLRACVTEDDNGPCWWDAEHRGNGKGRSFVSANGTVFYLEPVPQRIPLNVWRKQLKSLGAEKLKADAIPGHDECWALAPDGDTAVAVCRDGWVETS